MKAQRHEAMNAGGAAVRRLAIVPAALGQPLDHHEDEQDAQRRDEGVVVGQEPEGQPEDKEQQEPANDGQPDGHPCPGEGASQCRDDPLRAVAPDQRLDRAAGADDHPGVERAHRRGDHQTDDMRRAAVLIGETVAAKSDQGRDRQEDDREEAGQAPRLVFRNIDEPRSRRAGAQHDAGDQHKNPPADQHIGRKQDQAQRDADIHQPMPAVNENDAEHGQAEGVAEEQQQQVADARPGNPRPQRTAQPPAHAARRQPFGQQGEAGGQRYPAKPDQCTQGRAVAVERAPFALQRRRRIGQHADIRYRLVLEAHDDVLEPAGGSGGHLAGFGGNPSYGGRSFSRRSCCIGRPGDRNRKRDPRQSDD